MSEEQQQAAAPAANDTKTSWSFGDFAKGLGSPLTKNEDGSYNVAGALLTGAGSGLVTWVLSRMLGIKSGPSLGISILAALAGTHGAFTKQGGLDFFSNPKGYLKDFMDQKRVNGGGQPEEGDQLSSAIRKFEGPRKKGETVSGPIDKETATSFNYVSDMSDEDLLDIAKREREKGLGNSPLGKAVTNELNVRSYLKQYLNEDGYYHLNQKDMDDFISQAYKRGWTNTPKFQMALGYADDDMRREQEAMTAQQNAYYQAVDANNRAAATDNSPASYTGPRQGYGQYDVDAMMGNYPQISPQEAAMNASMRNARETMVRQQEAMRNALRSSDIIQQRRQRLYEQDMADVARRTEEIKKQQAMDASMSNARKQMAMTDAMNRAKSMVPPVSDPL